jgi:hypothetical protein
VVANRAVPATTCGPTRGCRRYRRTLRGPPERSARTGSPRPASWACRVRLWTALGRRHGHRRLRGIESATRPRGAGIGRRRGPLRHAGERAARTGQPQPDRCPKTPCRRRTRCGGCVARLPSPRAAVLPSAPHRPTSPCYVPYCHSSFRPRVPSTANYSRYVVWHDTRHGCGMTRDPRFAIAPLSGS